MNKNINKESKEIALPLSTQDFEKCKTRCGVNFTIRTILFGDHKPFFPTKVHGYVSDQGRIISAIWNNLGKCTIHGSRETSFDLVQETSKNENRTVILFNSLNHANENCGNW
jgi:hypothetical protein